ncbi:sulfite exporter TauE/SafE family protein [Roseococcus thiosulfatophilus]|uniref:sulfite exporter TauE/SafE family protein n=1 Tax=Roseococcus thiosulfatophilus TaxID=35813 RepID=UPI001A8CD0D1|nr:sulfite exporter TauE/SafE family protein [Roseococcus thiosulfatophilus]
MVDLDALPLAAAFFLVALVYASVGQAGATGYIALMAWLGFAPPAMKITALALNLLVAAIGTALFLRAGRLSWRSVWPYAALGFPFSLLGGAVQLPPGLYFPVVGVVLLAAAAQMARSAWRNAASAVAAPRHPPFLAALATGAVIGFVSGTTGTGGGVFLAPVILAMNWATARQTAATTAVYNLMNSGAALLGAFAWWGDMPPALPLWLVAVALGGVAGAALGSRYLPERALRLILALILLVSGARLLLG